MDNATRNYELVFIALPQLEDEALAALTDRVSGWITSSGGEIARTNVSSRQRLAYAIRKESEGFYIQIDFRFAPNATRELERSLRLDEQVLRHLLVRTDED